jgi:hypothetical protein
MLELMGAKQCSLIGIRRMRGYALIKWFLFALVRLWRPIEHIRTKRHERIGAMIFQEMIDKAYGGEVTFTIPLSISDLRGMIANTVHHGHASHPTAKPVS